MRYRDRETDAVFGRLVDRHRNAGSVPLKTCFAVLKDWLERSESSGRMSTDAETALAAARHAVTKTSAEYEERFRPIPDALGLEVVGAETAKKVAWADARPVGNAITSAAIARSSAPTRLDIETTAETSPEATPTDPLHADGRGLCSSRLTTFSQSTPDAELNPPKGLSVQYLGPARSTSRCLER